METMPHLVLIHSPLVGPLTWQPCADFLRALNYPVQVPSLAGLVESGPPYYPNLATGVAAQVRRGAPAGPVILVGHSGAGPLLPAIAEAVGPAAGAAIFVDAGLPHPGASWLETVPAALGDRVRGLARGGRLPPWHAWFPPEAIAELLPEAGLRARFVAELPELPITYFEERAPAVEGWPPPRCAYLQLSSPYERAAEEAERRGWPTLRESADHLAMLTRPEVVARLLERLVQAIGRRESGDR